MAIDIRKSISALLDRYGHSLLYIRRDLRFTCECYVERSGESKPSCDKCFGLGYVVSIERRRSRRQISSVPETLVGLMQSSGAGMISSHAYVYYLEFDVEPKKGDLLVEVEWDDPESVNRQPVRIKEKNLISHAEPELGAQGRIEFYQVYSKYEPKGAQDETALRQS